MALPQKKDFIDAIKEAYKETFSTGPLVTRLLFTAVFWVVVFLLIKYTPLLKSPVLEKPLADLNNFATEQVNIWMIVFQIIALCVTLLLSMIPFPCLISFKKISLEEFFRLYYNACIACMSYSIIFFVPKAAIFFFIFGCLIPVVLTVTYRVK